MHHKRTLSKLAANKMWMRATKPADIPVEQPTKFDLAVNLITAKAIDLTILDTFLVRWVTPGKSRIEHNESAVPQIPAVPCPRSSAGAAG
jgi:hypothetical protein